MNLHFPRLAERLFTLLILRVASERQPDFIIGADSHGGAYLNRWYLTPWRRLQSRLRDRAEKAPSRWNRFAAKAIGLLPNLYLHEFLRDDDDRALHDHPSWAASLMLSGAYVEHTIAAGGIHRRVRYSTGDLRFLRTRHTHRIELLRIVEKTGAIGKTEARPQAPRMQSCWTLFLFGPTVRDWGFHCPERGWVHWKEFTAAGKPGEVGRGCDA